MFQRASEIITLLASLSGVKIQHSTYLTRVLHLLHHCAWTWQFVLLILYGSKQHFFHLSVSDVRTCRADQHLQIGCGCQRLSQGCVFDGGDVGQVRGGAFSVYQQSRDGGLGFQRCGPSPICANVFLWQKQLCGCISGCYFYSVTDYLLLALLMAKSVFFLIKWYI